MEPREQVTLKSFARQLPCSDLALDAFKRVSSLSLSSIPVAERPQPTSNASLVIGRDNSGDHRLDMDWPQAEGSSNIGGRG